jgi:nitrogen fixation/metabolism regulation signal transduction histidine kinase
MVFCSVLLVVVTLFISWQILLKRKIEKEIEKERQHFKQNRFIAMGELMCNISHHWKQPLSYIALMLLNIEKKHLKGQLNHEYLYKKLDIIEDTIDSMSQTLEKFTEQFTPTTKKSDFSINETIENAIKLLSFTLENHHIEILFKAENKVIYKGHKNELIQALIIVLNNARDALIKDSANQCKKIMVTLQQINGEIKITIKDNAEGISKEFLHKIFDPYFTTNHKTDGRGLGLYMAKVIVVEEFLGRIDVYNSNGAVFDIFIPTLY